VLNPAVNPLSKAFGYTGENLDRKTVFRNLLVKNEINVLIYKTILNHLGFL